MIGKSFSGIDECYVCGKILKWTKVADTGRGSIVVYEVPDVRANAFAIGKNYDGSIKFEVECTCPNCRTINRFIKSISI
jgi:hypothetical protein